MKLLTFLGAGNYERTTYVWQEREHTCRFAPVASSVFLQPNQLILFLTEDAEVRSFSDLQQELPAAIQLHKVPVPLGKDERELWQIFEQVSKAVNPGEEVAFDITHGLRSFPLLGLLAAAFLRSGLAVKLQAVLYGAYDVRDRSVEPHRTQMFDLTPMLTLLEWSAAADRFNRTGDARYLASLLDKHKDELARSSQNDRTNLRKIGNLGNLAGALDSISQSLRLIRPHLAMEQIAGLPKRIESALPALEMTASVSPFQLLLDSVVQNYQQLGQEKPRQPDNLKATLHQERKLIQWYVERQQWVQAVALAREWLVNWIMTQLNLTEIYDRNLRQRIEYVIGAESDDFVQARQKESDFTPLFLADLHSRKTVLSLWQSLTQARNDILHAGMRPEPGLPKDLIKLIEKCLVEINSLRL